MENNLKAEQVPIITITLDWMKQSIMQMLQPDLIKEAIEQRLEKAIKSFDFDSKVTKEAEQCLSESVHAYFHYGEGGEMIHQAVKEALSESLKNCKKNLER